MLCQLKPMRSIKPEQKLWPLLQLSNFVNGLSGEKSRGCRENKQNTVAPGRLSSEMSQSLSYQTPTRVHLAHTRLVNVAG